MPEIKVDADDVAYLVLTATRFKCLLDVWQQTTGQEPDDMIRDLDQLIAAQEAGKFTAATLEAFAAGYAAGDDRAPSAN